MNQTIIENLPTRLLITGHWESKIVVVDGKQLLPGRSQKIINHSPDGFAWGYGGSGPAQLSLAILLLYLPQEEACMLYHSFKFEVVATWPQTDIATTVNLKEEIKKLNAVHT